MGDRPQHPHRQCQPRRAGQGGGQAVGPQGLAQQDWDIIRQLNEYDAPGSAALIDAELARDASESGQLNALAARVLRPDPAMKAKYLATVQSLDGSEPFSRLRVIMYSLFPGSQQALAEASAAVIAWSILMFFALLGRPMLNALGISLASFRIAGGILLFYIAVEMIFERRTQRREVLDTPKVARREWSEAGNDAAIRSYYDEVWVYGDPAISDALLPAIAEDASDDQGRGMYREVLRIGNEPSLVVAMLSTTLLKLFTKRFSYLAGST